MWFILDQDQLWWREKGFVVHLETKSRSRTYLAPKKHKVRHQTPNYAKKCSTRGKFLINNHFLPICSNIYFPFIINYHLVGTFMINYRKEMKKTRKNSIIHKLWNWNDNNRVRKRWNTLLLQKRRRCNVNHWPNWHKIP